MKRVTLLRRITYQGPDDWVDKTIARSINGKLLCGVRIEKGERVDQVVIAKTIKRRESGPKGVGESITPNRISQEERGSE